MAAMVTTMRATMIIVGTVTELYQREMKEEIGLYLSDFYNIFHFSLSFFTFIVISEI